MIPIIIGAIAVYAALFFGARDCLMTMMQNDTDVEPLNKEE